MNVKCVICEQVDQLADDSILAKKLRNRPIHTYLCDPCKERIASKTEQRFATGNFKLYEPPQVDDKF